MPTYRLLRRFLSLFTLSFILSSSHSACAQEQVPSNRAELERQFAERLSGATLVGSSSDSARPAGAPSPEERYALGEVRKLSDNRWLIQARIQADGQDVTVPLTLPVEWAGDTPVIVVDQVDIPGMGAFSARVMFHGDHYVGLWEGAKHRGHLFGVVQRAAEKPLTPDSGKQLPDADGDAQ